MFDKTYWEDLVNQHFGQEDLIMKLKDKDIQPSIAGLPESRREWWQMSNGCEAYIVIGSKVCTVWITDLEKRDITYEIAKHLKLDVSEERLTKKYKGTDELYTSMSINCLALNYTKPENYKELLEKIEVIINEHIKNR